MRCASSTTTKEPRMKSPKTVGLAVAVSLVAATVAAFA
jgi:hypothetical protein